ncbi:MAG: hypothetical protein CSB49_06680 [Proteobacteria bacterium]|nr:MAG: hypothetical protein CSB49_06680 [Pseudomonadota bacterium]
MKGSSFGRAPLVVALAATLALAGASSACSSLEVVRLEPGLIKTPPKTEPLAAIQVSCVGFYLFTLGIPTCDLEKVVNEILIAKAREIGASKLLSLRFRQTPESGVWWLTKLLWFRTARVSAIAVVAQPAPRAPTSTPTSQPGRAR